MSNPNYKMEELIKIEDDYLRRKIDEHLRIDRLAKANSQVLAYEVMANDPEYPHPPTEYHIKYFLKSIVAIDENQKPVMGEVHELRIKIPRNFPEQTAESKMLSPTWHPNIKSSGPFIGDICTNHKGFGSLYNLDELIVRIGEYLQYKRYLAEDLRTSIAATLHYRLIHRFSSINSRVAAPHAPRAICRPAPLTRPPHRRPSCRLAARAAWPHRPSPGHQHR